MYNTNIERAEETPIKVNLITAGIGATLPIFIMRNETNKTNKNICFILLEEKKINK